MGRIITILFLFTTSFSFGQKEGFEKSINRIDSSGKRQGLFITRENVIGYGLQIHFYIEQGFYINDREIGIFEFKTERGLLIKRNIYLDTASHSFQSIYFYPNGRPAKIADVTYNPQAFDSTYEPVNDTSGFVRPVVRKGKYFFKWVYYDENGKLIDKSDFDKIKHQPILWILDP